MNFTDVGTLTEVTPLYRLKDSTELVEIPRLSTNERPQARGKFLSLGDQKLFVRGVTYGTFRRNGNGVDYPDAKIVDSDFANISANGFNAVRTYTIPPRWLLDIAHEHGLYVMLGFPWEQHISFLDDKKRAAEIEIQLMRAAHQCAGHPAVLAYAIGNEIPASIVRWHGHRRVERYLKRLHAAVKDVDPEALVTYVNYPTTEYLELPFLDFVTFNVYLESKDRLQAYAARLQNIAGDRPLIMSEIGLDSLRNGAETQATVLAWQIRTIFEGGCAGAFVFAWTDEWHRGGHDIEDWDFGLTTRSRQPKPALLSVRGALREIPFRKEAVWPRISVIVCTYNGGRTLRDCLDGLAALDYPNFEVIVINDGSTDGTKAIAISSGFRVISTENCGLSHARNIGLSAASGEIVAYIDDDAYPDPHWLTYLAATFENSSHAGSADRIYHPLTMDQSRIVSRKRRVARSMCSFRTMRRNTFPAVTWHFARPPFSK